MDGVPKQQKQLGVGTTLWISSSFDAVAKTRWGSMGYGHLFHIGNHYAARINPLYNGKPIPNMPNISIRIPNIV